jgi:hypothetical protein
MYYKYLKYKKKYLQIKNNMIGGDDVLFDGYWIIEKKNRDIDKNIFTGEFIGKFKDNPNITNWSGTWYGTWYKNKFEGFYINKKNIQYIEITGTWDNALHKFTGKYNDNHYEIITENFDRFIKAQQENINGKNNAMEELKTGEKIGHWSWYFFPITINDKNTKISDTSKYFLLTTQTPYYGIIDIAKKYLMYDYKNTYYLRNNLFNIVDIIYKYIYIKNNGMNIYNNLIKLFGTSGKIDVLKCLRSLIIFIYAASNLFDSIVDDSTKQKFEKFILQCYKILNDSREYKYKFSSLEEKLYDNLKIIKKLYIIT